MFPLDFFNAQSLPRHPCACKFSLLPRDGQPLFLGGSGCKVQSWSCSGCKPSHPSAGHVLLQQLCTQLPPETMCDVCTGMCVSLKRALVPPTAATVEFFFWRVLGGGQGRKRKWRLSKKDESPIPPFHGLRTVLSQKGGSNGLRSWHSTFPEIHAVPKKSF